MRLFFVLILLQDNIQFAYVLRAILFIHPAQFNIFQPAFLQLQIEAQTILLFFADEIAVKYAVLDCKGYIRCLESIKSFRQAVA